MIGVIGIKRAGILLFLAVLNIAVASISYSYVQPEVKSTTKRVKTLRQEVGAVQADIDSIQIEFEQLGDQQLGFEQLKKEGFFKLQTRNEAKDLFQKIQVESGVISAVASVKSGQIEDSAEAQKAKHKLLASKIEITINAFDDTDIYKYIALAENNFIGHLSLDSLDITRVADVTPPILRAISSGENPVMVVAKIGMTWRTMVSENQIISEENQ
jgi:hypothetical protein